MNKSWISIARDVAIIIFLTFLGGFVIGLASRGQPLPLAAIAISNLLFGTVGFFIAGCLTRVDRWKHLFAVALFVWIISLVNVAFFHVTLVQWLSSAVAILLMLGVGGGLSFLFVRQSPKVSPEV